MIAPVSVHCFSITFAWFIKQHVIFGQQYTREEIDRRCPVSSIYTDISFLWAHLGKMLVDHENCTFFSNVHFLKAINSRRSSKYQKGQNCIYLKYQLRVVNCVLLLFVCVWAVVDQLPPLGKRELICLLLFTCNYVIFVWRGFLFLWVLGMGYVILLWHSLSLPYNYFIKKVYSTYFNK